jgi:hypothetical protein
LLCPAWTSCTHNVFLSYPLFAFEHFLFYQLNGETCRACHSDSQDEAIEEDSGNSSAVGSLDRESRPNSRACSADANVVAVLGGSAHPGLSESSRFFAGEPSMAALSFVDRFKSGLKKILVRARRRASLGSKARSVEVLEGRRLLSTLAINNLHDSGQGPSRLAIIESHKRASADRIDDTATSASVSYYNANQVSLQPVSLWQGLRGAGAKGKYLISGTSKSNGLLFVGSIKGVGKSYFVNYPHSATTSLYGPDFLGGSNIRLVGVYKNQDALTDPVIVNGFLYQGTIAGLSSARNYRTIDYPGATINYVHSTDGGLAVGNYDRPIGSGPLLGPVQDYIYNVAKGTFVTNIVFPGSVSDTAYGIWHNGGASYTIAGGYSDLSVNNMNDQTMPIGQAYLVDYNSATGQFSHWTSFSYPGGAAGSTILTHFEGISSVEKGVYTLNADSAVSGSTNVGQGSFVTVRRNASGTFGPATWVKLNYPGSTGINSSNSVFGNAVVGLVTGTGVFAFQATVNE